MFCAECGHDMRLTSEPMRETFRGEEFVVDGIERYVCDECGEYSISPEMADRLTERLAREYAMRHGLLAPDEIRDVRKALGLRQSEFERVLGVSTPSASRWETGATRQSKPVDLLIRVARDVPGAAKYLSDMAGVECPIAARATMRVVKGRAHQGGWKAKRAGRLARDERDEVTAA